MQHATTMEAITILCSLFSVIFLVSAGRWTDWQPFGPCTAVERRPGDGPPVNAVDLQEGTQNRSRFCIEEDDEIDTDEDEIPLKDCKVDAREIDVRACRIPTVWSKWSKGECSVTCGSGKRILSRQCVLDARAVPSEGKKEMCRLGHEESVPGPCVRRPCLENGGWSEWSDWGACGSAECHFPAPTDIRGLSYKIRTCSKPFPKSGGKMCEGPFVKIGMCLDPANCPTDGGWSDWTLWGRWNCKQESRNRTRVCNNPPSRNGGRTCEGSAINFYDKIQNLDSFNKTCGTVPKPDPAPVPSEEKEDYDDSDDED